MNQWTKIDTYLLCREDEHSDTIISVQFIDFMITKQCRAQVKKEQNKNHLMIFPNECKTLMYTSFTVKAFV